MLVGPLLKLTKRARKADHVTQRSGQVAGKLREDDAMTPAPSTLWGFSDGHLPAAASTYGGILSIIYAQGDPSLTSIRSIYQVVCSLSAGSQVQRQRSAETTSEVLRCCLGLSEQS